MVPQQKVSLFKAKQKCLHLIFSRADLLLGSWNFCGDTPEVGGGEKEVRGAVVATTELSITPEVGIAADEQAGTVLWWDIRS